MVEDLFGEIPVTKNDIEFWMKKHAPNIRDLYKEKYIEHWNVVEKIKRAKKEGTFQ